MLEFIIGTVIGIVVIALYIEAGIAKEHYEDK